MRTNRPVTRVTILAVVTMFAIALCVVGARTQDMGPKTVTVTITAANPPTVSPETVEISKSAGDQVEWVCPDCKSGFQVHFAHGSPFSGKTFGPKNPRSGRANPKAHTGLYHYAVTVNGHTIDPGVQVTP